MSGKGMLLYPAIDILGGKAVRLQRGDYEVRKIYDADPLQAARRWVRAGAQRLHVVDLDGARDGRPVNLGHVRAIAAEVDVPVQLGGGLRTLEAVDAALDAGAARAILGTAALTDPELLERALRRHGAERVMVSVDARGGGVVTEGWQKASGVPVASLIERMLAAGVTELLYTDVERDGMLQGVGDHEVLAVTRAAAGAHVIYSGGVGSLEDLRLLSSLDAPSLVGVIVGKALYEQRFTVAEAQEALGRAPAG